MIHQRREIGSKSRRPIRPDPELAPRGLRSRMTRIEADNADLRQKIASILERMDEPRPTGARDLTYQELAELQPNGAAYITRKS